MIENLKDQMTATFGHGRIAMSMKLNKVILSQTKTPYPDKPVEIEGDRIVLKFDSDKGLQALIDFLIEYRKRRKEFFTKPLAC